jgi:hypothetical protein
LEAFKPAAGTVVTLGYDELQLTAFSNSNGNVSYAVRAGRITGAQRFLSLADMQKLRGVFTDAQQKRVPP